MNWKLVLAALSMLCGSLFAAEIEMPFGDGLASYLYTPTEKPDATKTYWLVVGVHGAGGNGKGACGVAEWARQFDDVLVLGPTFEQPKRDPNAPRPATMPRDVFQMSGPKHEAKLDALIAEIGKTWKLHPKLVIHGFSAGAQFAHRYAFHHPERVAAVSAHSGGSWAKLDGEDRINAEAKRIPFAISCGEEDRGSGGPLGTPPRIEGAKRFAADLQSLGFDVAFRTWPGIGHEQTADAKAMGRTLLETVRQRPSESAAKQEPTRLYIANDDHTDYMWTADAETYADVFVDMIDYYLALTDATAVNPPPYQSRFNPDGSFWLWTYERRKSAADFERLIARIKDGHFSAPLNPLVSCYGGQPAEAVLRGMYYAGRLERRYDMRFSLATSMENQTQPLGLASLWAGSGARYSWKGVCGCASKVPKPVLQNRPHEIYWYAGLDGQRVLMKWYSLAHRVGTYLEAGWTINTLKPTDRGGPYEAIDFLDHDAGFLSRYHAPGNAEPYRVRGAFGFGGDSLAEKTGVPGNPGVPKEPGLNSNIPGWPETEHFHEVARKESNAARQVITSSITDFFKDFEKTHGNELPTENVTYGNEWDLYSASMSETSARVRRSVEKLRAAELMATLVALQRPNFLKGREAARDQAFMDLGLYWEHDWTADGHVSREARAAWQEQLAAEIEAYVNPLHADAATRLGGLIQKPDEKAQRFFVLNPLGFARTDAADFVYRGSKEIHVRDVTTGQDVPHQFIRPGGIPHLRILVSDVPATGYKVFEILAGPSTASAEAAAKVGDDGATMENARVKIAVDRDGALASFIDKAHPDVELAATIDGLKLNDFAAKSDDGAAVAVEDAGPVSVTLRCESRAGVPHVTRITLFRDSDRVEIRNEITENFADVRHWAFSFNLAEPDVHTEEVGAVIRVKTKAQGGDYADTHARYDYATLNHFADITDGANARGVTLSNSDCAFVKLGHSTPESLDTSTAQLSVLAGGQVDGGWLGIHGQNGETHFLQRFALRSHGAYDAVAAMKFALAAQNPLVTGAVVGNAKSPYPADAHALLSTSNPNVLLWSVKPAEEGIANGIIARAWNVSGTPQQCDFALPSGVAAARRTTHVETDLDEVPLRDGAAALPFAGQQMQTVRLMPK